MTKALVGIKEAAKMLGLKPESVRYLMLTRKLEADYTVGKIAAWNPKTIEKFKEQREAQ